MTLPINDICRISRTHYLPKWGWIVVTLLAIPVGGIAYYLLERREGSW
ncbi:PLDc N-terminal domain-containing protein [Pediococcus acidilactici]|nr:PLDc N-terminal domain-containing protein [Pediococcus acidilactici]WDV24518.1 PLDc N-terminal domain-containing protein [Pediococcus acidilactici]WEE13583.1 PLDc N-terminal domain-containing protein [Pediococcus acidilactici]